MPRSGSNGTAPANGEVSRTPLGSIATNGITINPLTELFVTNNNSAVKLDTVLGVYRHQSYTLNRWRPTTTFIADVG